MDVRHALLMVLLALVLGACSDNGNGNGNNDSTDGSGSEPPANDNGDGNTVTDEEVAGTVDTGRHAVQGTLAIVDHVEGFQDVLAHAIPPLLEHGSAYDYDAEGPLPCPDAGTMRLSPHQSDSFAPRAAWAFGDPAQDVTDLSIAFEGCQLGPHTGAGGVTAGNTYVSLREDGAAQVTALYETSPDTHFGTVHYDSDWGMAYGFTLRQRDDGVLIDGISVLLDHRQRTEQVYVAARDSKASTVTHRRDTQDRHQITIAAPGLEITRATGNGDAGLIVDSVAGGQAAPVTLEDTADGLRLASGSLRVTFPESDRTIEYRAQDTAGDERHLWVVDDTHGDGTVRHEGRVPQSEVMQRLSP